MKKYSKCIIQVMIIIDIDAEEKTKNLKWILVWN